MKYLHKSLYFPNQIFQNGYVTLCYSSCQKGEGLHGCHSSNRKKVLNGMIGRQKGYNSYDWIEHGISTQLLQTLFKVKGVVHYGIAGNADPQLEIGDVTIPQFWAHSGLWNWQEVESNLSRFWNVLESKKLTQAVVSKLEEALWINNRKYDALWCWEMLKLLVHFALRTRMRQGFQKVLQCFLKAFNEFVQRRVSHYKELNPTENLLLLKAFCELQAQDRNRLKSNFCGLVLLLGSLPWRLNYQNLVFPHCRFQVVVAERIKLKEKKIKYTNELESKV
ncbi:uncharacterized protein LOC125471864 isoform X9 [Pyrus x bretschneideri]|uniref:uncharacterized protein LOC125471864 isoform X9 n=2 Tax=Pyrus x bretschneideri TaxID=225117 RepID=UPI00202FD940|nr:uncharacterized protein LOC125471864 isoform X9 [Pyrus x bretschneideri]